METLFSECKITQKDLDEIKTQFETSKSIDKIYLIELKDKNGKIYCIV